MKHFKLIPILAACSLLFYSCENHIELDNPPPQSSRMTPILKKNSRSNDWVNLPSRAERISCLQLDEETLQNISTAELVTECFDFPYNLDCFAYNDHTEGLKSITNEFNGYQELKTRPDAIEKIVAHYSDFLNQIEYLSKYNPSEIDPLQYAFTELVIASDIFGDLSTSDNIKKLFEKSLNLIFQNKMLQGEICHSSNQLLNRAISFNPVLKSSPISFNFTIYTPNGSPVNAEKRYCDDNTPEQISGENYIHNRYNVKIVGNASCEYNCHSYAWYMRTGGEKCWIDQGANASNLQTFWEDGSYGQCDAGSADVAYYSNDNHSAIVITTNMFESKWGAYQVVQHAPQECPYKPDSIIFYSQKFGSDLPFNPRPDPEPDPTPDPTPDPDPDPDPNPDPNPNDNPPFNNNITYGNVIWNHNPDPVSVGESVSVSIEDDWNKKYYTTTIAIVSPIKNDQTPIEDSSSFNIISRTEKNATVQFLKTGVFAIRFNIYHNATGKLQATYISDEIYVL